MAADRLDAVLPLLAKDLERFSILDWSFKRSVLPIRVCWVVARDTEYALVNERIAGPPYRVIRQSSLIPELEAHRDNPWVTPWFTQQLIKLSIAQLVETPFYLTLDADVVCVRSFTYDDVIVDRKAVVRRTTALLHRDWYEWVARVLEAPQSMRTHGVTPAIFATEAVLKLQAHLAAMAARSAPGADLTWRSHLLDRLPWTEYALYHSYLEHTGQFDSYHVDAGESALYDMDQSIEMPSLDVEAESRPGRYFVVVQSNTGIAPALVFAKVKRRLGAQTAL
jgi:hypothetical protein